MIKEQKILTRDGKIYLYVNEVKSVSRHGTIRLEFETFANVPNLVNPRQFSAELSIGSHQVVSIVNALLKAIDTPETGMEQGDINVYNPELKDQELELLKQVEELQREIKELQEENLVLRMSEDVLEEKLNRLERGK